MLLNSILKTDFLVALICQQEVSALLQPVSLTLQAVGTDLVAALSNIDVVLSVLRQWQTNCETAFVKLFAEVTTMATDLGIQVAKSRTAKRSVYRSNATPNSASDIESYYRVNVFNPILDHAISDLTQRFMITSVSQCYCFTSRRTMY